MKFRALRSFRHGAATYRRGLSVEVSEPVGRDLIQRRLVAEEGAEAAAATPRPAKKPAKPATPGAAKAPATSGRTADGKED